MSKYTIQDDGFYHIPIIDFGTRLRDNFGLTIVEHPHFDPVDDVHVDGSLHYSGNAIDVQDHRGGADPGAEGFDGVGYVQRTENLERLLQGIGVEVIGPQKDRKGHGTHLHLGSKDGIFRLNEEQYKALFGGNFGGKLATFSAADLTPTPPTTDEVVTAAQGKARTDAKTKAQLYTEMSKSELDSLYDTMRKEDPAKAQTEGMKMWAAAHPGLAKKVQPNQSGYSHIQEALKKVKRNG